MVKSLIQAPPRPRTRPLGTPLEPRPCPPPPPQREKAECLAAIEDLTASGEKDALDVLQRSIFSLREELREMERRLHNVLSQDDLAAEEKEGCAMSSVPLLNAVFALDTEVRMMVSSVQSINRRMG